MVADSVQVFMFVFFFQAEDGIRDIGVTGVQTCALPICPWPPPARPWLMGQTWYELLFAHWAVPPEVVRPLVAEPLRLDERDGHAWLGITPFVVGGLRPHRAPPPPWLSRFPELNVRTYVDYRGRPGIYFFRLHPPRPAALPRRRG